jgi:hypothetical protein
MKSGGNGIMAMKIVCEGRRRQLKHLKKGFIFSLYDGSEWVGNFEVLKEIDENRTVRARSVSPGIGEKVQITEFVEGKI